ncbi:hypothetical protein P4O66_022849, partial [Electrophorus voltai]
MRQRDSGECQLMLVMADGKKYLGSTAVNLTVTGAEIRMSPSTLSEGQTVPLSCSAICTFTEKRTYIWYKNRPSTTKALTPYNSLYPNTASYKDMDNYTCAVCTIWHL